MAQSQLDDLVTFFRRRWFDIVWVKQETILADKIACFCGMWEIPWSDLESASVYLMLSGWSLSLSSKLDMKGLKNMIAGPSIIWRARKTRGQGLEEGTLDESKSPIVLLFHIQVHENRAAEATDPRDKLYGLLGFATMRKGLDLAPNYDKPVWQVFAEWTRAILEDMELLIEQNAGFAEQSTYVDWLGLADEPSLRRPKRLPS